MSHHDVDRRRHRPAGLTAAVRLAEAGARVLVLAKGVGATHLSAGHDRRARLRARAGRAPARGARPRCARRASLRARRRRRRSPPRSPGSRSGSPRPARAVRLHRRARGEPAAADRRRRAAAVRAWCRRRWPRGDLRDGGAGLRRRLPGAEGLPSRRCWPTTLARAARASRRARSSSTSRPRAARTSTRSASRAPSTTPRSAAGSPAQLARAARRGERVAFPAVLGIADPHAVWTELEQRLGRPVFEVPTLPPSVPGMRVFAILREALRRAGGRVRAQQRRRRRRARGRRA